MSKENLEETVSDIADHLKELVGHSKKLVNQANEISTKASHFLENYRKDYYDALDGISYQKQINDYQHK